MSAPSGTLKKGGFKAASLGADGRSEHYLSKKHLCFFAFREHLAAIPHAARYSAKYHSNAPEKRTISANTKRNKKQGRDFALCITLVF